MSLRILFHLAYMASAVLFIVGLKFLSHPKRARSGNLVAAGGMVLVCGIVVRVAVRAWRAGHLSRWCGVPWMGNVVAPRSAEDGGHGCASASCVVVG